MPPFDELTAQLTLLRAQGFPPPPPTMVHELTPLMLQAIGIPEAAVRDTLIYATFVHWIELQSVYTPDQLREIMTICTDKAHLWYEIHAEPSDAVFTRSFSVLLIPLILIAHLEEPFLLPSEVQHLKAQILGYLDQEHDFRGWVSPTKGWAHALAHTADALSELARCDELDVVDLQQILTSIQQKLLTLPIVLTHAEDERLVNAIDSIIERNLLPEQVWINWIEGFHQEAIKELPQDYIRCINSKHLLQSLYFHSHTREIPPAVRMQLHRTIEAVRALL